MLRRVQNPRALRHAPPLESACRTRHRADAQAAPRLRDARDGHDHACRHRVAHACFALQCGARARGAAHRQDAQRRLRRLAAFTRAGARRRSLRRGGGGASCARRGCAATGWSSGATRRTCRARLRTGLRSYFLRSTFSVFQAWAMWASERSPTAGATRVCARRWTTSARAPRMRSTTAAAGGACSRRRAPSTTGAPPPLCRAPRSSSRPRGQAIRRAACSVGLPRVRLRRAGAGGGAGCGALLGAWPTAVHVRHVARAVAPRAVFRSKSASAVFHFVGRLQQLIFLRWKDVARGWRNRRLGHLAAKLHFEGTLVHRLFYAWQHYAKYVSWRCARRSRA